MNLHRMPVAAPARLTRQALSFAFGCVVVSVMALHFIGEAHAERRSLKLEQARHGVAQVIVLPRVVIVGKRSPGQAAQAE